MFSFKCKNCGGNLIPEPGVEGRGRCDSCFCVSIIPSITDEQRTDRHNRGIDFRRARKFDDALQEFSCIVRDNPRDAQAHWDMMLSRYGINYEKDYRSGEYIPTCDRLSQVPVYDDPDYKAALQWASPQDKPYYQQQGAHIEKIRLGMMALAAKAEAYDVFICYKDTVDGTRDQRTEDSHFAHDVYMDLTNKGYRVFFSRVTLKEEHLGQEWEPVIYAALNTAKLMLVIGTSRANIESPWVKNEWTRFLAVRSKDMSKSIITCFDGDKMTTDDIPPELAALEAINFRESTFFKNIQQTVFAHCSKREEHGSVSQRKSADNYAKRALQCLEDKDWDKADEMLEEALNLDPENGEAHLGKMLLSLKCQKVELLEQLEVPLGSNSHYSRAVRYASPERKNQLMAINQVITTRFEEATRAERYDDYVKQVKNLTTTEEADKLEKSFAEMGDYREAARYAEACRNEKKRLEAEEAKAKALRQAKEEREKKEAKLNEERRDRETQKLIKKAKRKRRRKRIRRFVLLMLILGFIAYKMGGKTYLEARDAYEQAVIYDEAGDYRKATELYFVAARADYKNAEERGLETCELWLGMEPVVLTSEEYPWWGVDDNGGLTLDYGIYDASVEFKFPTIMDGELITGISEGCFYGLEGLTSINLPANITWIGDSAFLGCVNLSAVGMEQVERIGEKAFKDCNSLTNVVLPDSCKSIGLDAFSGCNYMNNLTLNEGLEEIGVGAFYNCSSLTNLTLPSTVVSIGEVAFYNTSISNLTIMDGVQSIGERVFPDNPYLTAVTIPGSVTDVGNGAFCNCDALTTVVLNGVTNVGEEAFRDCEALTSVTFGDGLQTIGASAFAASGISGTVELPAGLTSIGYGAFINCDNIYEVYVGETTELTVGVDCFYECDGLNGAYFATGLTTLEESCFNTCRNMTWVNLPEGLVTIGRNCFAGSGIYDVNLPSTLTTIGEAAFYGCDNIQGIRVPAGVTVIESYTFAECENLWWLWFQDTLSIIRDNAVEGSGNFGSVYFSGSGDAWNNVSKGNNQAIMNASLNTDYYG